MRNRLLTVNRISCFKIVAFATEWTRTWTCLTIDNEIFFIGKTENKIDCIEESIMLKVKVVSVNEIICIVCSVVPGLGPFIFAFKKVDTAEL